MESVQTSGDAIKALYKFRNGKDKKFSLGFIAMAAGIPSRGYISDVMKGRRVLSKTYQDKIAKAFKLSGLKARFLALLIARDHAEKETSKRDLTSRLAKLTKALAIEGERMPKDFLEDPYVFDLFCVFGLCKQPATLAELAAYFPEAPVATINASLQLLKNHGYVNASGRGFSVGKQVVRFMGSDNDSDHVRFVKSSLKHESDRVGKYFNKDESSHFEALVVSMKSSELRQFIQRCRADIIQWQADLESDEADMILRMNVQIYPSL